MLNCVLQPTEEEFSKSFGQVSNFKQFQKFFKKFEKKILSLVALEFSIALVDQIGLKFRRIHLLMVI